MRTATPDFSMDLVGQITCDRCAAVLDNVIGGTISVRDGIAGLHGYRRTGTEQVRRSANLALRLLAYNADIGITQISQRALHEQLNEEMWNVFRQYYKDKERLVQEYHEVSGHYGLEQSEPF